ncbi:hypothetical protein GQ600_26708 [Phytophthora cactorum]|nr:hypothetical protein GQ600_26708 [Phytophthora cactorum]
MYVRPAQRPDKSCRCQLDPPTVALQHDPVDVDHLAQQLPVMAGFH